MKIKKAVIPAAGFGTRFLPATKTQPKEMLPIINKPAIHYVVEEAINSGIEDILIITGRGKHSIEDYFDHNYELEHELKMRGKEDEYKKVSDVSEMVDIYYIRQKERKGLGDAVNYAKDFVGNDPFIVMLADDLFVSEVPVTKQVMDAYEKYNANIMIMKEVSRKEVSRYGIIDGKEIENGVYIINRIAEKPSPENAPSNLATYGRYAFNPEIFEYLENTEPGVNGEVQLTDALNLLLKKQKIYGIPFEGKRYDIGTVPEYIKTIIDFALESKFKDEILSYLSSKS